MWHCISAATPAKDAPACPALYVQHRKRAPQTFSYSLTPRRSCYAQVHHRYVDEAIRHGQDRQRANGTNVLRQLYVQHASMFSLLPAHHAHPSHAPPTDQRNGKCPHGYNDCFPRRAAAPPQKKSMLRTGSSLSNTAIASKLADILKQIQMTEAQGGH